MTIAMVHLNPVLIEGDHLTVDRKFHDGMCHYATHIRAPLISVHPPGKPLMDVVRVPVRELPYAVSTDLDPPVSLSHLVYTGSPQGALAARRHGIPYVLMLEYDLRTFLTIIGTEASGLRRGVRTLRHLREHALERIPLTRGAQAVHCNGYPIFDEVERYNTNRLLYLDSRMSEHQVIEAPALQKRLTSRSDPLRLLYSGRYERLKGADDAVRVAVACLQARLPVTLDCYGQGSLKGAMEAIAGGRPEIRIHDTVPYPELVRVAQESADVFVCCHIQSDPSCTYVESLGAGLPIVGYGNRMWRRMEQESMAGFSVPIGNIARMVEAINWLRKPQLLAQMSFWARRFALKHCFEREFQKRIDALNALAGVL